MSRFTRGFKGRGHAERDSRLPPGQYDAGNDWPVLNAEVTPKLEASTWTFAVEGLVERPTTWTWDQIHAVPPSTYSGDIHCVTAWSKLGMTFMPVGVDPQRLLVARDIKLEQFTHSVEVETERGDIEMTPGKLPLAAIEARSGSGKIELLLPEKAAFALIASQRRVAST